MSAVTVQEIANVLRECSVFYGNDGMFELAVRIEQHGIAPPDCVKQADDETHRLVDEAVAAGQIADKRVPVAWAVDTEFGRGYVFAEELLNALPPAPMPEPVAWRFKALRDGEVVWQATTDHVPMLFRGSAEPLYAAPHYTCKFCGAPSWLDPSEQDPPPDYCHESDHGAPEFDRNMALPPNDILEAAAKVANWFAVRNINEWKLGSIQSRRDGGA